MDTCHLQCGVADGENDFLVSFEVNVEKGIRHKAKLLFLVFIFFSFFDRSDITKQ